MIKKNKYLAVFLCILILLLFCSVWLLLTKRIDLFDQDITLWACSIRNTNLTKLMILISEFGSASFLIVVAGILFLLIDDKKTKILLVFNALGTFLINQLLKIVFRRMRPLLFMVISQNGYSYPSGHAMISASFYGLLSILSYKHLKNRVLKYGVPIILIFLILAIGFSRIYLGVHYFSDVVTGFILGAIILCSEKLLDKR